MPFVTEKELGLLLEKAFQCQQKKDTKKVLKNFMVAYKEGTPEIDKLVLQHCLNFLYVKGIITEFFLNTLQKTMYHQINLRKKGLKTDERPITKVAKLYEGRHTDKNHKRTGW